MGNKWGFLRETREKAKAEGIDKDTGYFRTGLEDYLAVIFPEINEQDWIHNKSFGKHNGNNYQIKPDYRCNILSLIVEFDGLQHYKNPVTIARDSVNQTIYEGNGYKVVRIPYFIQLTNEVVKQLFGVDVNEPLFPENLPSMGPLGRNTPAFCCPAGLFRMANELKQFPQQMEINIKALENANNETLTGISLLKQIIKTGSCQML